MRTIISILPMLAACAWAGDPAEDAIRKAIATFNDPHTRATVQAPGAEIAPLDRVGGPEVSRVYFEAPAMRFPMPDVAKVKVSASQYGSLVLKRTIPVVFVLKRDRGVWRISALRIGGRRY
jgi:hypothetical protein